MPGVLYYAVPIIVGVGTLLYFLLNQQQEQREQYYRPPRREYHPYDPPPNGTCTICQDDYTLGIGTEKVKCGHVFHRECYNLLLSNSGPSPICPNCKSPVF